VTASRPDEPFDGVLFDYLHDRLDADALAELSRRLETDPDCRRRLAALTLEELAVRQAMEMRCRGRVSRERTRRRRPRRAVVGTIASALAVAAAVALILSRPSREESAPTRREAVGVSGDEATVPAVVGRVAVARACSLEAGDALSEGTVLACRETGSATVALGNESTLEVGPESELRFERIGPVTLVALAHGRLEARFEASRPVRSLRVSTRDGTVTVERGRFALEARAGRTRLRVTDGAARLDSSDGEAHRVESGHGAVCEGGTVRPELAALWSWRPGDPLCAIGAAARRDAAHVLLMETDPQGRPADRVRVVLWREGHARLFTITPGSVLRLRLHVETPGALAVTVSHAGQVARNEHAYVDVEIPRRGWRDLVLAWERFTPGPRSRPLAPGQGIRSIGIWSRNGGIAGLAEAVVEECGTGGGNER